MRAAVLRRLLAAATAVIALLGIVALLRPEPGPPPRLAPLPPPRTPSPEAIAPGPAAPAAGCPFTLRVTDADGRPLPGALVTGAVELETSAAGEAVIDPAPEEPVHLRAFVSGFAAIDVDVRPTCGGRFVFALQRAARLVVSVQDARGAVENAVVLVSGEQRGGDPDTSAQLTDRDGLASFDGLRPGEHHVRVQAAGAASTWDDVALAPGQTARLDLRLSPSMPVAGVVLDPAGAPVAGAAVEARAFEGQAPELATVTAADGTFALTALASGAWSVAARGDGFAPSPPSRVERATAELVLRLRPGASVHARVELDGRPATGITVNGRKMRDGELAVEDLPPGAVHLEVKARGAPALGLDVDLTEGEARDLGTIRLVRGGLLEGRLLGPRGQPVDGTVEVGGAAVVTRDGAFVVEGLPAGELEVTALAAGLASSRRRVTLADGETTRVDLHLEAGARVQVLVLAARGVPVPGAEVSFLDEAGTELLRTRTSEDGRARSEPLSAGSYVVLAEVGSRREAHPVVLGRADVSLTLGPPGRGASVRVVVGPGGERPRVASFVLVPGRHEAPHAAEDVARLLATQGLLLSRDGAFTGVPPGPHTAIALLEGPRRDQVRAAVAWIDVPSFGEVDAALALAADAIPFTLARP